jgi:subtilisin family serine protease
LVKRRLLFGCVLSILILTLIAQIRSMSKTGVQAAAPQSISDKISPWLLARSADGGPIEFLVVLAERADLRAAEAMSDKFSRGSFTQSTLLATAEATQAPLRSWLEANRIEYRSFYIVNALWVRATREVALAIAARPEVARLDANPRLTPLPSRELGRMTDEAVQLANEARNGQTTAAVEPGLTFIHAPEVWAQGFTGQNIVIGGADTGVQWDHPALKNHYRGWNGAAADHNYNWHDSIHTGPSNPCGVNTAAPCDDDGHGTHTVGSAVGDDGAGNQIGVAPGAKFIACRNMERGNGTPASYLECMEFFLAPYPIGGIPAQGDPAKAPDITINSWTCPQSEGCQPETLRIAVEAQRAAGIMMVVAAGNEGPGCTTIGWPPTPVSSPLSGPPSHYDAAYTVGAVSSGNGLVASFSSRGPVTIDGSSRVKPDITAPGVGVRSATRNSGYTSLSGTSMAAPHVAGAIALLWSAEPALRHRIDLTETLLNVTATPVASTDCGSSGIPNNVYGYGHLNISAAVQAARTTTFSVGGRVVTGNGIGIGGVLIAFTRVSGDGPIPASVYTDANGNWNQTGFTIGTVYRARPIQPRQRFTVEWQDFNAANSALNFTRVERRVIIQGTVPVLQNMERRTNRSP